jgi:thiamine-phosphate pyrophosphorylase
MRLLVLTDRHQCADLAATVAAATRGGAPAILFREKELPAAERRALGERVADAAQGAELIVASDPELAHHLGASTVHLAADDPWPDGWRTGRSCHDDAELADAASHGASYATLSPIFASASKPGYGPPLGPAALADAPLDVLALGGVTPANVADCLAAGAAGVAVMGGVMAADDPEAAVRALLDAGATP